MLQIAKLAVYGVVSLLIIGVATPLLFWLGRTVPPQQELGVDEEVLE